MREGLPISDLNFARSNAVLQQSLQCQKVNLFLSIDVNFKDKCGKHKMYMWTTIYNIAGVLT